MKFESKSGRIAVLGMLTALSLVLMYFKTPMFLPFLEYEAGDVPALIASLLFGPVSGLSVIVVYSAIQAMTVSAGSGIIGFIMHVVSSGAYVVIAGLIIKKYNNTLGTIVGLVIGGAAMTLLMIPMNLLLTPIFTGLPVAEIAKILIPSIIPFNLVKAALNGIIAFALFRVTKLFYKSSEK